MLLSYIRTAILYCLLIVMFRLLGKRQLGQLEASEFVVALLVADLAAVPMQDGGIPLLYGLVPILTVLALELLVSQLSLKSLSFRRLLCGRPVILVENGRANQKNMRRTRVTLDELTGQLRQKEVLSIKDVQYAILETNGALSVFPYPEKRPASAADAGVQPAAQSFALTVISDGKLRRENLKKAGKDLPWLRKQLKNHRSCIADTWLLTVDSLGQVTHYPKEG